MYSRFFGFEERPFKLLPNPAYLFLSRGHEEALAHLTYAADHGDGFVVVTGEVGTGKTTLCRAFLENLAPDVEAAYIFNPKLNAVQLLQAINAEFGLPADAESVTLLSADLNGFLIAQKEQGRKVILMIDEAQNLSPEVLEQLRLLSNLETTRNKLLQIILVGQPELADLLDSYELRQLRQRITLHCHLAPLSFKETRAYIRHRLQVASRHGDNPFSRGAVRIAHRYASGIPRLVNIVCDRALLTAFGRNRTRVTGREMRAAVRELNRRGPLGPRGGRLESVGVILLVAVFAVVVGLWLYPRPLPEEPSASLTGTMTSSAPSPALQPVPHPVPQPLPADEPAASATIEPAEGSPSGSPAPALTTAVANHPASPAVADNGAVAVGRQEPGPGRIEDLLVQLNGRSSRRAALQKVLNLWQSGAAISASLEELETDDEFFRYAARQLGLEIERLEADAALLVKLDLPAVLMFDLPNRSDSGYLALTRLAAGLVLEGGDAPPMTVAIEDLSPNYTRTAYVVWKNFKALRGTIPLTSDAGTVILLKSLLKEIGIDGLGVDARYDPLTRQVVEQLQARYGIPADGFVGPLTKIVLYNAHAGLAKPRLLIP